MPLAVRRPMAAVWAIDLALADVISTTTEPALGAIRLAWWREQLERLDTGAQPPPEWRLREVATELVPRGISGLDLAGLEDGWLPLLEPFPWHEPVAAGLRLRGRILFSLGARLLNGDAADVSVAGELWSLVDGARHCSDVHSRIFLLGEAREVMHNLPESRPPKFLRRLTGLAAMAAHDVLKNKPLDLPYESAGRGMAAMLHYARGTLPHG